MAYSTYGDIQAEIKGLDLSDQSAALQAVQVTAFIAQGDAEIDSRLSVKYQTPVAGTQALTVLKTISTYLAVERCLNFLEIKGPDASSSQAGQKSYDKLARQMLTDLATDKMRLIDAPLLQSANGIRSGNVDNGYCPFFDITTRQW